VINVRNPGGAAVAWAAEYRRDEDFVRAVLDRAPEDRGAHQKLSDGELEALVVSAEGALVELRRLEAKYAGTLAEDEAFRNARVPRVGG
jgi:hypothetical protein